MNNPEKYIKVEIRQYVEKEIQHLADKCQLVQIENEKALHKAEKEMERRLEGMNEFREQLEKQTRTFITRDEYLLSEKLLNSKIDTISKLTYIGLGIVLVLEVLLRFIIK